LKISVIIPALNEAGHVAAAIRSAMGAGRAGAAEEVIVADGGSSDGTAEAAILAGAKVIKAPRGRGGQMDAASEVSSGDVLLFLHADSRLPEGWREHVDMALKDDRAVAGAFRFVVDAPGLRFRLLEAMVNLRAGLFGLIYGDQAIFSRKNAFIGAGGFRKLRLMEDVDCVRRLRVHGSVVLLRSGVLTSPRRWENKGIIRNAFGNLILLFLYYAGFSTERLYRVYYKKTD